MKKIISALLAVTMLLSTAALTGCSSNESKAQNGESVSDKDNQSDSSQAPADLGKLGFVTEFRDINMGARTYATRMYVMRNTENDVYVLTGLTDSSGYLTKNTANIFKVTDGFTAADIQYCTTEYHSSRHDVYFYIFTEDHNIYKTTIYPGKGNYSEPYEYEKPVTCTTEKVEVPEAVSKLVTTEKYGNYALTKEGNVYAWYNYLKGTPSADYRDLDNDGKEIVSSSFSETEEIIGFSDGKRHDTPTKLPLKDVKDIVTLNSSGDAIAFLTNSGEVYRCNDSAFAGERGKMLKLDGLDKIKKLYRIEDYLADCGVSSDNSDVFALAFTDNDLIKVYSLDCSSFDSREEKCSLSNTSVTEFIPEADNFLYNEGTVQVFGNDFENYVFNATDGRYYQGDSGKRVSEIAIDIPSDDYMGIVNDLWLNKKGEVFYYGERCQIDNCKVAENVKAINYISAFQIAVNRVGFEYLETPKEEQGDCYCLNMLYFKDGSTKLAVVNEGGADDTSKYSIKLQDVDSSIYGNGTRGVLVPTADGKYQVCTKNNYSADNPNKQLVVDEIEIPE